MGALATWLIIGVTLSGCATADPPAATPWPTSELGLPYERPPTVRATPTPARHMDFAYTATPLLPPLLPTPPPPVHGDGVGHYFPTSTPAATSTSAGSDKPLAVSFVDAHYECQKTCWDRDDDTAFWAYRSFQALMKVENRSKDLTLRGGENEDVGWAPTTWIITDGATLRRDDYAWQYGWSQHDSWVRPDLPPGASSEWTWLAVPLRPAEWVAGVEYVDEWGNLYTQGFPKPEGGAANFADCGAPLEGGPCYGRSN